MGVSWTGGIPKWMVDFMDNPIFKKMPWGYPHFKPPYGGMVINP